MSELKFTEQHEWIRLDGDVATIGISGYASEQLGDVVYVELPEKGRQLEQSGELAVVESVKAASEVYAPISGEVVEVKSMITKQRWGGPNDETALINLRFKSGATADLCSSVLFQAPTAFELYGSKGFAKGEGSVGITGEGLMWTDKGAWEFAPVDPYQLEIEDFAAAVRENRAPEVDGLMGRKNTAILLQATELG